MLHRRCAGRQRQAGDARREGMMLSREQYQAIEQEITELEHRIEALKLQLDTVDGQYRWAAVQGIPGNELQFSTDLNVVELSKVAKTIGQKIGETARFFKNMTTSG